MPYTPTLARLDLLARADKRIRGAIDRTGRIDSPEVIALVESYSAQERALNAPDVSDWPIDRLTRLWDAMAAETAVA